MKYFSVCSGIGGFELGIYRAIERIKTSTKVNLTEDSTVFKEGNEIRGFTATCVGYSEIDTYADTKTMGILPKSATQTYLDSICWSEDSLAKHFPLLVNAKGLTKQEEQSFLTSKGFLPTKDPDIWYSKTLRVCYLMTMEKLSRQYLGFSPTLGITFNGRCLTLKTLVSPKTGNGCSLSDVLDGNIPEKYFLSEESVKKIKDKIAVHQLTPTISKVLTITDKEQ